MRFSSTGIAGLALTDRQTGIARSILDEALTAAQAHDGSQNSGENVLATAMAFESCAREILNSTTLCSLEYEAQIALAVSGKAVDTRTLLDIAIASFGQRLQRGAVPIVTVKTEFVFLPPDHDILPPVKGYRGEEISESERTQKAASPSGHQPAYRTQQLILLLNRHNIYTDDLVQYTGVVTDTMMRRMPYTLIQIPRLNREVLICDQAGQASYVGIGLRGPAFWAIHRKSQLAPIKTVGCITHTTNYEARLLAFLLDDNPPGKKVRLSQYHAEEFPITAQFILIKALEHAEHTGNLPTVNSGDVADMTGVTWRTLHGIVADRLRGFDIPDLKGLHNLLEQFGLKNGRNDNPRIVAHAIKTMHATGHHGLRNKKQIIKITPDLILEKALRYAARKGDLPTVDSGEVAGMPGQTWVGLSLAIRKSKTRTSDMPADLKGLSDLFKHYGYLDLGCLKIRNTTNRDVLERALTHIRAKQPHGLVYIQSPKLPATRNPRGRNQPLAEFQTATL